MTPSAIWTNKSGEPANDNSGTDFSGSLFAFWGRWNARENRYETRKIRNRSRWVNNAILLMRMQEQSATDRQPKES
jgi:hypothetical protein